MDGLSGRLGAPQGRGHWLTDAHTGYGGPHAANLPDQRQGVAAALDAQARKARFLFPSRRAGPGATHRKPRPPCTSAPWRPCTTPRSTQTPRGPSFACPSIAELAFEVADDGRGFDPSTTRQGTACRAWPTGSTHSAATSKSIQVRPAHQDQRPSTRQRHQLTRSRSSPNDRADSPGASRKSCPMRAWSPATDVSIRMEDRLHQACQPACTISPCSHNDPSGRAGPPRTNPGLLPLGSAPPRPSHPYPHGSVPCGYRPTHMTGLRRTRVSYAVIFVPAVTIHRGADRLAP
jgi:hypothetical protein